MLKRSVFAASIFFIAVTIFQGCYYDKADQLYPSSGGNGGGCDTTNVQFSVEIKSILDANCKSCHNGTNSVSGIDLYDYNTISGYALDGQFTYGTLLSAVMHEGGAPFMPQSGGKISDCDINKIAAWVHGGALNN